jgi:hypothetical protein
MRAIAMQPVHVAQSYTIAIPAKLRCQHLSASNLYAFDTLAPRSVKILTSATSCYIVSQDPDEAAVFTCHSRGRYVSHDLLLAAPPPITACVKERIMCEQRMGALAARQ